MCGPRECVGNHECLVFLKSCHSISLGKVSNGLGGGGLSKWAVLDD